MRVEEHCTCSRSGHVTHPIGLEDTIHVLYITVTHPILTQALPEITHSQMTSFNLSSHPSPDKSSNVLDEVCSLGLLFPHLPVRLKPLHSGLVQLGLRPFDIQEPQDGDDTIGLKYTMIGT